jgi:hypothetical protein
MNSASYGRCQLLGAIDIGSLLKECAIPFTALEG